MSVLLRDMQDTLKKKWLSMQLMIGELNFESFVGEIPDSTSILVLIYLNIVVIQSKIIQLNISIMLLKFGIKFSSLYF